MTLRFLSYGGGVQTRAAIRFIMAGDLPRPEAIFFGDTQDEPAAIYEGVEVDKRAAAEMGIPFHVATWGRLSTPPYGVHSPLYTIRNGDGKKGQLFRTCTDRFKIRPIRQMLRRMKVTRAYAQLGITKDEIERVKPSTLNWYTHEYPMLDMTRADCEQVLRLHGIEPVKSACVFCPYRSQVMWETLHGSDLNDALNYDESIRDIRLGFKSFVHSARVPLRIALAEHIATEHNDPGCPDVGCFL